MIFYFIDISWLRLILLSFVTVLATSFYEYLEVQILAIFSFVIIEFLRNFDFDIPKNVKYSFYPGHLVILIFLEKFT